MSVEALFTKQWNNTRYAAQPRFPLKSKNQGSAWGTDTTPEFLASGKEEKSIHKNIAGRPGNFRLSSFYIPPIAKTTEAVLKMKEGFPPVSNSRKYCRYRRNKSALC